MGVVPLPKLWVLNVGEHLYFLMYFSGCSEEIKTKGPTFLFRRTFHSYELQSLNKSF